VAHWPLPPAGTPPAAERLPHPTPSDAGALTTAPRPAATGTSSAGSFGGGGPSPVFFAILAAALAALAQAARTIPQAVATARSVSLVLLVERPG
jgi:hypothetical protein